MAVGAFFKQHSKDSNDENASSSTQPDQTIQPDGQQINGGFSVVAGDDAQPAPLDVHIEAEAPPEPPAVLPVKQEAPAMPEQNVEKQTSLGIHEEIAPLNPVLAAAPISSPSAVVSATYSAAAPAVLGNDSPYSYSSQPEEKKSRSNKPLLRWSGKNGSLQIGSFTISGAVTYWSDGAGSIHEPCCIDITLPVEFPSPDTTLPADGAVSYEQMTPLQRGVYLTWLAGGRIQPPLHMCYPAIWLFGLERRVLVDKLDLGLCLAEAFRLLPLLRWENLRGSLIRFITWLAAKLWLPEEQLIEFCKQLPYTPSEILSIMLHPYANSKMPLPSAVAFYLMNSSAVLQKIVMESLTPEERSACKVSNSLFDQFAVRYKNAFNGSGLLLPKPKSSLFVACTPANASLASEKNASGGVLELPDFFKDTSDFFPLMNVWREFVKEMFYLPVNESSSKHADDIAERPDLEAFVLELLGRDGKEGAEETSSEEKELTPVTTTLSALADVMKIEHGEDNDKARGGDRKKIVETAQVEGYIILPDLGIAGKEYYWGDSVCLYPVEMGFRPWQHYNAAALILEFVCALAEIKTPEVLDAIRTRLDDYFSLSSDDHKRLTLLGLLFSAKDISSENLEECFKLWIQKKQRKVLLDLLVQLMNLSEREPESEYEIKFKEKIYDALEVEAEPPAEGLAPLLLGEEVVQILAPLFKNS